MNRQHSRIAGFMSAESIYSLAFYIVMVAAIAGVGAGIMSKSASAKGVSAVSILRANYQAQCALTGYNAAPPTALEIFKLTHGLVSVNGANAVLTGVGTFSITDRPAATPAGFSIMVEGVSNVDVCKSLASVGWGSWDGVAKGSYAAASGIPSSAATSTSSGLISAKSTLLTVCNAVTGAAAVELTFFSQ